MFNCKRITVSGKSDDMARIVEWARRINELRPGPGTWVINSSESISTRKGEKDLNPTVIGACIFAIKVVEKLGTLTLIVE